MAKGLATQVSGGRGEGRLGRTNLCTKSGLTKIVLQYTSFFRTLTMLVGEGVGGMQRGERSSTHA